MQNVYRFNRPKGLQSATVAISEDSAIINFQGSISDSSFKGVGEFPIIAGPLITFSLSLEEFIHLPGFDSGAMMIFDVSKLVDGQPVEWQNIFVSTYVGRRSVRAAVSESGINAAIRILVPSKHITSMRQCKWMICMASADSLLQTDDSVEELANADDFTGKQFLPVVTGPSTIPVESEASFAVQLQSSEGDEISLPADIYVEATSGILNRARVALTDSGFGSFMVSARGLQAGDQIKIKAGFRYFSGAFEKIVAVV